MEPNDRPATVIWHSNLDKDDRRVHGEYDMSVLSTTESAAVAENRAPSCCHVRWRRRTVGSSREMTRKSPHEASRDVLA